MSHFKFLSMVFVLVLIACGGGGGGGSDSYGFEEVNNSPEIVDLVISDQRDMTARTICNDFQGDCIDSAFTQYPEGLFLSLFVTIEDPDLDAEQLRWKVLDAEGNIVVEPEEPNLPGENILLLPQMDRNPQAYLSDDYEVLEFGGPYTFTAYVIDAAGNESPEWIEEFCILSDRYSDVTTCQELRYTP